MSWRTAIQDIIDNMEQDKGSIPAPYDRLVKQYIRELKLVLSSTPEVEPQSIQAADVGAMSSLFGPFGPGLPGGIKSSALMSPELQNAQFVEHYRKELRRERGQEEANLEPILVPVVDGPLKQEGQDSMAPVEGKIKPGDMPVFQDCVYLFGEDRKLHYQEVETQKMRQMMAKQQQPDKQILEVGDEKPQQQKKIILTGD